MNTETYKALQQQAADLISAMLNRELIPANINSHHPHILILGNILTDGVRLNIDILPLGAILATILWYAPPTSHPDHLPHVQPIHLKLPRSISHRLRKLHREILTIRRRDGHPIPHPNPDTATYLTAATATFTSCYKRLSESWNTSRATSNTTTHHTSTENHG